MAAGRRMRPRERPDDDRSELFGGGLERRPQPVAAQRPLVARADHQRFELGQPSQAPLRLLVVPGEGRVGDAGLAVGQRFQPRRIDQVDDVGDEGDAVGLSPQPDQPGRVPRR